MTTSQTPNNFVPVPLGCPPGKEGNITIPVDFDFSGGANQVVDFSLLENRGAIGNVQSLYIDNLANPDPVVISEPTTGQSVTIPLQSQGYMPLLAKAPNLFNVTCGTGSSTAKVRINFNNFYMPPYLWGAAIGTQ